MVKAIKHIRISKYKPAALQGRLNLSPVAGLSFSAEHQAERLAMRALIAFIIILCAAYLYFVTASVLNVMARREALSQVTTIQGAIGDLEQRYFALSQDLTPQEGSTLGLAPVQQTNYVYRPGNLGAATIARNEI